MMDRALWLAGASRAVLFAALGASGSGVAFAQTPPSVVTPLTSQTDPNNLNLTDGGVRIPLPTLAVAADSRLRFQSVRESLIYVTGTNIKPANATVQGNFSVHYGGVTSEAFTCSDNDCQSISKSGSLFLPFSFFQKGQSGETYRFDQNSFDRSSINPFDGTVTRNILYYVSKIAYPDGETISYTYYTTPYSGNTYYRPKRISSNLGYHIDLTISQMIYWIINGHQ